MRCVAGLVAQDRIGHAACCVQKTNKTNKTNKTTTD